MKYSISEIAKIIKSNEPVFTIRARDLLAVPLLKIYRELYKLKQYDDAGSFVEDSFTMDMLDVIGKCTSWQRKHKTKFPDIDCD